MSVSFRLRNITNSRKYVSSRVFVWSATRASALPHVQFVRSSNGRLKAILKAYIQQGAADATRFIGLVWKSISGSKSVESFLAERELIPSYGSIIKSFHKLEHVGDFLLAGRSLHDAFDTYSCLIYTRMILMARNYFLKEVSLVGLVIKCGRSAESDEQKKLAFELLEYCLLSQSITGVLTDAVFGSLRQYYTEKNPSYKCHLEPRVRNRPKDKIPERCRGVLPTFVTTHRSMSPSWVVTKHSELYLPIQHAIYAHLWRNSYVDFSILDHRDPEALSSDLQECQSLATAAHILAQDMLKRSSKKSFGSSKAYGIFEVSNDSEACGSSEACGRISVLDTLSRLFSEVCSMEVLDKLYPTTTPEEVCFLDSLQALYQDDSHTHIQCMQWLQAQAFAFIESCSSLKITRRLPISVVPQKNEVKYSTEASPEEAEAVEVEMTQSSHSGAPDSSLTYEAPSAKSQSVYLCSSSMPSSMLSMMSMASRIKRNTGDSALLGLSQLSSNSMAMSLSGSFDFSRVTGIGSDNLPEHSIDIMEIDEDSTFEEDVDEDLYDANISSRENPGEGKARLQLYNTRR